MNCPICNTEMETKEVLTCRTTDPKDDDTWEKVEVCPKCENIEPIINSVEENEDDY